MLTNAYNKSTKYTIKIKSPQSEIKLHNMHNLAPACPEIAILGNNSQADDDDMDKITRAWNRLKIRSLSKAIAISPEVGPCTLGPKSVSAKELGYNSSDLSDIDKPDLRNAITSTPVKPKQTNVQRFENDMNETVDDNTKQISFDISEITHEKDENSTDKSQLELKGVNILESISALCISRIEAQVKLSAQKKREEREKLFRKNDEKIKKELQKFKMQLDNERLLQCQKLSLESEQMIKEIKENALQQAEEIDQSQSDHNKAIAESNERIKKIEQKRKELEESHKQKREELKLCINGIYEMQVAYGRTYNQINEITKTCRDLRALNEKVTGEFQKLRSMNELLLKIVDKSREGRVTLEDLQCAQSLVRQISSISEMFARHTVEINRDIEKAEEDRKKELIETELKAKQEVEQKAKEDKERIEKDRAVEKERIEKEKVAAEKEKSAVKEKSPEPLFVDVADCISGECLKMYLQLSAYLAKYEHKLQLLITNESLKKFRFDCQKVVNVPINAISPLDDIHLEDKLYKLSRLLQGAAVPLNNSLFLVTGHPLGISFCTNLIAKKFVKQGELAVSSKPEAAFAIAAVIVALWVDFPEFGTLLLAHFQRECPYLIPAFLPQIEGQSNESYYRQLGYEYSEDGKVESQDMFLRRMSGVMRLYAAILVTPLKKSHQAAGKKHPHSMREAWRWFTATLNLGPRTDISPTLIFHFLEVAGWLMYRTYGVQFTKLLQTLCTQYFPIIEQVTPDGCEGPVVRLKTFLEKILKEGQVLMPTGLLPHNFW